MLFRSFVNKGQLVAYVVTSKEATARVVLPQEDIGMVRKSTHGIEVVLAAWEARPMHATIRREVPGASEKLPTPMLGSAAGGAIPVDPRDSQGVTALRQNFQLELALPIDVSTDFIGARLHARFDHGYEPMGFQIYRAVRRLFLRQFSI